MRLRLEFTVYDHLHTPAFESRDIFGSRPYFLHRDQACLDEMTQFTAAGPFQYLIIGMINGWMKLRLEFGVCNGHHNVF